VWAACPRTLGTAYCTRLQPGRGEIDAERRVSRILVQGGCAEHTEAALQAHADTGLRVVAVTTHPDEGGDWAAELS
jgi:hypothetical protein